MKGVFESQVEQIHWNTIIIIECEFYYRILNIIIAVEQLYNSNKMQNESHSVNTPMNECVRGSLLPETMTHSCLFAFETH